MSEWISVEDGLPPEGNICLLYITYPKGTMFNCRADPLNRTNINMGARLYNGIFCSVEDQMSYKELKHVTHWMPLPNQPEEK
jgi:hypothetical protein